MEMIASIDRQLNVSATVFLKLTKADFGKALVLVVFVFN